MDETRAINGNMPQPDPYRPQAAAAADDGSGDSAGNAYERARRARRPPLREDGPRPRDDDRDVDAAEPSDPLLMALDRMAAVEGYRPVDEEEWAQSRASRAYGGSSTYVRRRREEVGAGDLSSIDQHDALEHKVEPADTPSPERPPEQDQGESDEDQNESDEDRYDPQPLDA